MDDLSIKEIDDEIKKVEQLDKKIDADALEIFNKIVSNSVNKSILGGACKKGSKTKSRSRSRSKTRSKSKSKVKSKA
jgi:hypothetical protein